jgi:hypothetical protein
MAKKHRFKVMSKAELSIVQERNWVPVSFAGAALPSWLNGIPKEKLVRTYGSGTYFDERIVQLGHEVIPYVVAGYDVFRYDQKDEAIGFPINKDHYIVIKDSTSDERYLVIGPEVVDGDHWFTELPQEYPEIEIIEFLSDEEDE